MPFLFIIADRMKLVRKFTFFSFFLLLVAAGCRHNVEVEADAVVHKADTAVLSVALMPTLDCLPFYYAEATGIYASEEAKVRFLSFASQFDCDTALLGNSVDGSFSDLVRTQYHVGRKADWSVLMTMPRTQRLLVSGKLRIRDMKRLQKRMVAVARFSASDMSSGQALASAGLKYGDVFRPQVNDLFLRMSMLDEGQVDAAVLPEPFATVARLRGHKLLHTDAPGTEDGMGCLTFKSAALQDTAKAASVRLLLKGYRQASGLLKKNGKDAVCRELLHTVYGLSDTEIDSLSLPDYGRVGRPDGKCVEAALGFLRSRGQAGNSRPVKLCPDYWPR